MNTQLLNLTQKILDFADLEPDWDSYGAKPITLKSCRNTFNFYKAVLEKFPDKTIARDVAPLSDGGIQIEFMTSNLDLEVEIHDTNRFAYLLVEKGEPDIYTEDGNVDISIILDKLSLLYGNSEN